MNNADYKTALLFEVGFAIFDQIVEDLSMEIVLIIKNK